MKTYEIELTTEQYVAHVVAEVIAGDRLPATPESFGLFAMPGESQVELRARCVEYLMSPPRKPSIEELL